jgi:ribose-phosphate pyrophosphokinase
MNLTINFPGDADGPVKMFRYPGGEVQVRLTEEIVHLMKHPKVERIHVVAKITDGEIVALAQLLNAIKGATSADVKLILPYLPYARADRRFVLGDTLGLQVFAQLLNTISYDIVTLDVHSSEAGKYIRHLTDVSPLPIIEQVIDQIGGRTIVLLPDAGALRYGYKTGFIAAKVRDQITGKLSGFSVPSAKEFAECDQILIIDDICDGGGTFIGIAEALRKSGNTLPLYLYVTHGIFSKGLRPLLDHFEHIYTTDSFYTLATKHVDNFTQIPAMPTILNQIEKRTK